MSSMWAGLTLPAVRAGSNRPSFSSFAITAVAMTTAVAPSELGPAIASPEVSLATAVVDIVPETVAWTPPRRVVIH